MPSALIAPFYDHCTPNHCTSQSKLFDDLRILGKYGGVPAMGAGMIMQLPPRDAILKVSRASLQ